MKKLIIMMTGIIIFGLGLTACGEPPKAEVSGGGVEDIQVEEIRIEEIRVEEIKVEEIRTEDILKEDIITWDNSPNITRWE